MSHLFFVIFTLQISTRSLFSINTDSILHLSPRDASNLVKQEFVYAYNAYSKYAMGYDQLQPLTKNGRNKYKYSLLSTPIDALDTMFLMNLTDLVNNTLDLICNPSNNFTFDLNMNVKVSPVIISCLGGLLSSYHFLQNECLKNLAIDLGERLYPSFTTPSLSGTNWDSINLATMKVNTNQNETATAALATNIIEYGALTYLTKDIKYYNASKSVLKTFEMLKSDIGFVGKTIQINASYENKQQLWVDNKTHICSGIDSYYEYQIKCWKLFNDNDCYEYWVHSNESIMKYLPYYEDNIDGELLWFKQVNMFNGELFNESYFYEVHAPFFAGQLALSNNMYQAIKNQNANWFLWNKTTNSVEPNNYNFLNETVIKYQYNLNPENFESNYYLYMITNDSIYYDRALNYLYALIKYDRCDMNQSCVGYASLKNVETKEKMNKLPAYFFAESLKYLYLTFMRNLKDNPLNFDDYIFNTEGHPIPKIWGML
eukprot:401045_1